MLGKHHAHLKVRKVKIATIKLFLPFKDSIWNDDMLLNTNAKTNILCLFYSNELQVGKIQVEKFANV